MRNNHLQTTVYVAAIAFFVFMISIGPEESPTGSLVLLQPSQPGNSEMVPTSCSSTTWTACPKAFADDANKATVTVGSGVTKYVYYNLSFSPGKFLPSKTSRILNVTILPQISANA
ncbi:MAG: hypothetical protein AABW87_00730, partial [Nanoarchaeota archaeon]